MFSLVVFYVSYIDRCKKSSFPQLYLVNCRMPRSRIAWPLMNRFRLRLFTALEMRDETEISTPVASSPTLWLKLPVPSLLCAWKLSDRLRLGKAENELSSAGASHSLPLMLLFLQNPMIALPLLRKTAFSSPSPSPTPTPTPTSLSTSPAER